MFELSWHTHQINLWIALSRHEDTFSATLAKHGFECDVIEDHFYLFEDDGEDVLHPDIILTSPQYDYSLIVDCKSEEIDPDQLERYLKLNENKDMLILQDLVRDVDPDDFGVEMVLSSFSRLSSSEIPDSFAIVHFDQDPYSGLSIWNLDENPFKMAEVNGTFPINVKPSYPLPTGHYPFDVYEGDKEAMVSSVFSSVVSLAMQEGEFSIEDILRRSHPYWDKLGDQKFSELKDRVEIIYLELLNAGLEEYLDKIAGTEGQEWMRTSKTIQAVQRETDYYVERVIGELPQARLDHSAWSTASELRDEKEAEDDD